MNRYFSSVEGGIIALFQKGLILNHHTVVVDGVVSNLNSVLNCCMTEIGIDGVSLEIDGGDVHFETIFTFSTKNHRVAYLWPKDLELLVTALYAEWIVVNEGN